MKLPSNEIIHFAADMVTMTERNLVPGLMDTLSGGAFNTQSPFIKRRSRYDLKEIMSNT